MDKYSWFKNVFLDISLGFTELVGAAWSLVTRTSTEEWFYLIFATAAVSFLLSVAFLVGFILREIVNSMSKEEDNKPEDTSYYS